MRIAWFSPLCLRSGISKYTLSIVNTLSNQAEVDLWTPQKVDNFFLDNVSVYEATLNKENIEKLEEYDIVIYNMGNDITSHYEIYEFYKRKKGILILHDKVMHHFFLEYFVKKIQKPHLYNTLMEHYYGVGGKKIAEESFKRNIPVWNTDAVIYFPLFEFCLLNACGIIVHSKETLQMISKKTIVPCKLINHPFYIYNYEYNNKPLLTKKALNIPEDKMILLSSGSIVPSKRIDKVIKVISENNKLKNNLCYLIVGNDDHEYADNLKLFISKYQLENTIKLIGKVDDHKLHSYIKNADICVNLRFPSTESASGSLIEQLYFKKPVIVSKVGFYDELPDDIVMKIDIKNEEQNLYNVLIDLLKNQHLRETISEKAFKFAEINFSVESYTKNLLDFIEKSLVNKFSLRFIDTISNEIYNFTNRTTAKMLSNNLSNELSNLVQFKV